MITVEYQSLVRSEQNTDLMKEAAFERWLDSVTPQRPEGRLGRRLIRQSREWLERQASRIPCNEELPACGLIPA
jgi:hypothetical protein